MFELIPRIILELYGCCWTPLGVLFGYTLFRNACQFQFLTFSQFTNKNTVTFFILYNRMPNITAHEIRHNYQVLAVDVCSTFAFAERLQC
ncbi:hypothetical protein OQL93_156 [Saccharomyces cerevisiae synthetic construct]|uniref:Putative uncharacterized protein YIL021C-A n=2 Tax=Saccharomyces cerevisiae TaxID=4932 RepID=YI21A_YEAST|nr:RecName: Full=Putative uncharacterized protein YIL021C-A [Saccharomyces cerevisiae S288C]AAL79269.1 unknown [Saccharomyces cerevisiae]KZV10597.1 hypothetical protein WN66_03246 [Saccharomyces cerevisiae]WHM58857.1 hypothetical protein OQL93_156 [Saccharomyces cerevisiae synthetic construct]CAY80491.1 EC1118_1I12_1794p [Saccharomyces cerevisiae EC1118]